PDGTLRDRLMLIETQNIIFELGVGGFEPFSEIRWRWLFPSPMPAETGALNVVRGAMNVRRANAHAWPDVICAPTMPKHPPPANSAGKHDRQTSSGRYRRAR